MRSLTTLIILLNLAVATRAQWIVPQQDSTRSKGLTFTTNRHGDLVVAQHDVLGGLDRTTVPAQWVRSGTIQVETREEGLLLRCPPEAGRCITRERFGQGTSVRSSRVLLTWPTDSVERTALFVRCQELLVQPRTAENRTGMKP